MVAAERFGLDTNVLVYLLTAATWCGRPATGWLSSGRRRPGAAPSRSRAWASSTWSLSQGRLAPAAARLVVDDLTALFASPRRAVPTPRRGQAAVSGRFSYWDALLLATLARAGCSVVLSEDMHDGAARCAVVRDPFAGDRLPDDLEALLS